MSFIGSAWRSGALLNHGLPTVIYDVECDFCCRWAEWFRRGSRSRVRLLPLQDPEAAEVTGRSSTELLRAMHFVRTDGAVFAGAGAVREALGQLSWGWLLRGAMTIPGSMRVADHVYGWVARRRRHGGCGGQHCAAGVARGRAKR